MAHIIALALTPTVFVMVLGYVAGKAGFINNMHVAELTTVTMSFAFPASLFLATASTPPKDLLAQWPIFVSLAIVMMGTFLAWYAYQRWARGQDASESALQALAVGQPNFAAAGFPVIVAVFGEQNASTIAVGIAVGSLLPSPLTLAILNLANARGEPGTGAIFHVSKATWGAITKPIVLAPILGTTISFMGFVLSPVIVASLREIGQAAGGLALLVTGLVLSERSFRLSSNTVLGSIISNILQPLCTFAVCRALNAPVLVTKLAVIMAALPSGFFGILFGASYNRISDEANSTIIASTIFSTVTLAAAIAWTSVYKT